MKKPDWWPKNHYRESISLMSEKQYLETVPDPELRHRIERHVGPVFWDFASAAIWEAMNDDWLDGDLADRARTLLVLWVVLEITSW